VKLRHGQADLLYAVETDGAHDVMLGWHCSTKWLRTEDSTARTHLNTKVVFQWQLTQSFSWYGHTKIFLNKTYCSLELLIIEQSTAARLFYYVYHYIGKFRNLRELALKMWYDKVDSLTGFTVRRAHLNHFCSLFDCISWQIFHQINKQICINW